MLSDRPTRRQVGKFAAAAAVAATFPFGTRRAGAAEQLVIASFGGQYQDAQRKAFFEPFTKETGIKIVEVSGVSTAKVRSMVMTKNVEWDVFTASSADYPYLAATGLLEKIDYSKFPQSFKDDIMPDAQRDYGVGTVYSSQVLAYSTKAFGSNPPKSWADFWDVAKFPGPRLLPAATFVIQPVEPALLAAGVAPDKVYPLNLPLAYEMFTKIRPNVIRWVKSSSAGPQALVDGEVVMTLANSARVSELKAQGAAIDFTWNQGVTSLGLWSVPKGAKNYANALKFLEFASRSDQQAALARLMPYGPVTKGAFAKLKPEVVATLPTAPQNLAQAFMQKTEAWLDKNPEGVSYYDANTKMWDSWITK